MARIDHRLSHLIHTDPAAASKEILDAMRENQMHMANTAKSIGCTHGTLLIWIKKLDLKNQVDKLEVKAKKEGWFHNSHGGRPALTKTERERRIKARRLAIKEMTPAQKAKLEANREKKRQERLAAMKPSERKAYLARKAERKFERATVKKRAAKREVKKAA